LLIAVDDMLGQPPRQKLEYLNAETYRSDFVLIGDLFDPGDECALLLDLRR
jgi:hypothetical protein